MVLWCVWTVPSTVLTNPSASKNITHQTTDTVKPRTSHRTRSKNILLFSVFTIKLTSATQLFLVDLTSGGTVNYDRTSHCTVTTVCASTSSSQITSISTVTFTVPAVVPSTVPRSKGNTTSQGRSCRPWYGHHRPYPTKFAGKTPQSSYFNSKFYFYHFFHL